MARKKGSEPRKKVTAITMLPELWLAAKAEAARQNRSLSNFVCTLIEAELNKQKTANK